MESMKIGRREAVKRLGFSLSSLVSLGLLRSELLSFLTAREKYPAQFIAVGFKAALWLKDIAESHHHDFRTVSIGPYALGTKECWVDVHVRIDSPECQDYPDYQGTWEKALDANFEVIQNELRRGKKNVILAALGECFTNCFVPPTIVESCLYSGIPTQALVTLPFSFEGRRSRDFALQALEGIKRLGIPIIVIDREKFMKLRIQSVPDIFIRSYEEVKRACLALAKKTANS